MAKCVLRFFGEYAARFRPACSRLLQGEIARMSKATEKTESLWRRAHFEPPGSVNRDYPLAIGTLLRNVDPKVNAATKEHP